MNEVHESLLANQENAMFDRMCFDLGHPEWAYDIPDIKTIMSPKVSHIVTPELENHISTEHPEMASNPPSDKEYMPYIMHRLRHQDEEDMPGHPHNEDDPLTNSPDIIPKWDVANRAPRSLMRQPWTMEKLKSHMEHEHGKPGIIENLLIDTRTGDRPERSGINSLDDAKGIHANDHVHNPDIGHTDVTHSYLIHGDDDD